MLTQTLEIHEHVDQSLKQAPTQLVASEDSTVVLGDLHGNFILLLWKLIKHGVIVWDDRITTYYFQLYTIYIKHHEDHDMEDIYQAKIVLNKLRFNPKIAVILIGDELCDRGKNDGFTLLLIALMHAQGIKLEILLSNHTYGFVKQYLKTFRIPDVIFFNDQDELHKQVPESYRSYLNFQNMMNKYSNQIGKYEQLYEELLAACDTHYDLLKLVTYTLHEGNNEIFIYTHAPVGLAHIGTLCRGFTVQFEHSTKEQLAASIDELNAKFKRFFADAVIDNSMVFTDIWHPYVFEFLWFRATHNSERSVYVINSIIKPAYAYTIVHGHDNTSKLSHLLRNHKCLDAPFGKYEEEFEGTDVFAIVRRNQPTNHQEHTKNELKDELEEIVEPMTLDLVDRFSVLSFLFDAKEQEQSPPKKKMGL